MTLCLEGGKTVSSEIDYEQTNLNLILRAQNGDEGALLEAVELNLGLVHQCANKFVSNHIANGYEYDDLVQEGIMGMLIAIKKYDADMGMFSTYVFPWINNRIQKFVHKCNEPIRKPAYMSNALLQIKNAVDAKESENGCALGQREIEEIIEVYGKENKISSDILIAAANSVCVSFSTPFSDDTDDTIEETLSDGTNIEDTVLDGIHDQQIKEIMDELINSSAFTDNERNVIRKRFGFEGEPWTLQEIAKDMHLTVEGIRKTEVRVIRRFREILNRKYKYRDLVKEYSR